MKQKLFYAALFSLAVLLNFSCQKENIKQQQEEESSSVISQLQRAEPQFNLEVILRGTGKRFGLIKFRQDNDVDKVITLDTWVRSLVPNHVYQLQRAVDEPNVVDGNCVSNTWVLLGNITTDDSGTGRALLTRPLPASLASGTKFDIHFRVIEAAGSMNVVLTSDCYQYTVR